MSAADKSTISIPLDQIILDQGRRLRAFQESAIGDLKASIGEVGLISPISVVVIDGGYRLVTGLHRLAACRELGWQEIPAVVLALDELDAELAEIDENLIRRGLSALEEAEHLARRDELLAAKGERAQAGDNQYTRGGAESAPPLTTAMIAAQMGVSERTAQERKQIARGLPEEVRDAIRGTKVADRPYVLLDLARVQDADDQKKVAQRLVEGKSYDVKSALRELHHTWIKCKVDGCEKSIQRSYRHCPGCSSHRSGSEEVCGKCGHTLRKPPTAAPPALVTYGGAPIVGDLPQPFSGRGKFGDRRIELSMPDDSEESEPVAASEIASTFADAVDALTALSSADVAREAESPVVKVALRSLDRWLAKVRA